MSSFPPHYYLVDLHLAACNHKSRRSKSLLEWDTFPLSLALDLNPVRIAFIAPPFHVLKISQIFLLFKLIRSCKHKYYSVSLTSALIVDSAYVTHSCTAWCRDTRSVRWTSHGVPVPVRYCIHCGVSICLLVQCSYSTSGTTCTSYPRMSSFLCLSHLQKVDAVVGIV